MIKRESKKRRLDLNPLVAVVLPMFFATSALGTISIPGDTSVGTWDSGTRTYTLTTDVFETIQIDEGNLTLDGAGHTVSGGGSGHGVYLPSWRIGVTIKNLTVKEFSYGIYLNMYNSSDNTVTDNTVSNNEVGIYILNSGNNTILTSNTASNNTYGILLNNSTNNTLTDNAVWNNEFGIYIQDSGGSTLTGNSMSGNKYNFHVTGYADWNYDNNVGTSNTVDGKPVYYVKNAANKVFDSTTNAGVFYAINCNNITIKNLTLTNNFAGVFLWKTHNSTIENVLASSNRFAILLENSSGNDLRDNTTLNNEHGISLIESSGSTLTGNSMSDNEYNFRVYGTADSHFDNDVDTSNTVDGKPVYYVRDVVGPATYDSSTNAGVFYAINCDNIKIKDLTLTNNWAGVFLWNTHNSTIENVLASNNGYGIYLQRNCSYNTLTGNTANSNNGIGIRLGYDSNNNSLTGNTASNNGNGIWLRDSSNNNLTGNSASSNNRHGIYIRGLFSSNILTGNTINSNNSVGIALKETSHNTLTGNTINSNNWLGILLFGSNNTLTGNTISNNGYGIEVWADSSYSLVYNNNFIGNTTQAYVESGSGSLFNLPVPIGGNYWSDWTSPDNNNDGFVDSPYVFDGGQDDLPWVSQDGWAVLTPQEAIQNLIDQVAALDLPHGIENSLVSKLEAAIKSLDRGREDAAINQLNAFIKEVNAQRGKKKITDEQADQLIAAAQSIIGNI